MEVGGLWPTTVQTEAHRTKRVSSGPRATRPRRGASPLPAHGRCLASSEADTEVSDVVPIDGLPRDRFPVADSDRYTFISFIGKGGMGVVYKARDPQLHDSSR